MKLVAALFALSAGEGSGDCPNSNWVMDENGNCIPPGLVISNGKGNGSGDPEVTNCLNSNWELDENGVCQPKV